MTRKQDFEKHADRFDRKKKLAIKLTKRSETISLNTYSEYDNE